MALTDVMQKLCFSWHLTVVDAYLSDHSLYSKVVSSDAFDVIWLDRLFYFRLWQSSGSLVITIADI